VIVLTSVVECKYNVCVGDTFNLTVHTPYEEYSIIRETILENRSIDYIASFRFAKEDGTISGFHLSGFFGNKDNLPVEIENAVHIDDLSDVQRSNFLKSLNMK
jgi:hypothetical protein